MAPAYEYNRDTKFASNTWFNNRAGIDKEQLKRNQYGASLGGPITRGRAVLLRQRRAPHGRQRARRRRATVPSGDAARRHHHGAREQRADLRADARHPEADRSAGHRRQPARCSTSSTQLPDGNDPSARPRPRPELLRLPLQRADDARQPRLRLQGRRQARYRRAGTTCRCARTFADNCGGRDAGAVPGQDTGLDRAEQQLRHVGVATPASSRRTLVNVASFGLTHIRSEADRPDVGPSFGIDRLSAPTNFTRPFDRDAPTWNFVNDLTLDQGRAQPDDGRQRPLHPQRAHQLQQRVPELLGQPQRGAGSRLRHHELVNNYLAPTYGTRRAR